MKIFYQAHFAGFDGYGQTARDYVDLLIELGHDLTCRCINSEDMPKLWGDKWLELCNKPIEDSYDIAVVHRAPFPGDGIHLQEPFKHTKKIFWYTVFETTQWPDFWEKELKNFDKILTPSNWQVEAAKSIMKDKADRVFLLPHKLQAVTEKKKNDGVYTFYMELSRATMRKGFDIMLKAYFKEFSKDDNCRLLIKAPINQSSDFQNTINEISQSFIWKMDNLPRIDVCTAFLEDDQLDLLMNQADCFVHTSRGEGFCVPLATAASKGIPVLFPMNENYPDFSWGIDYIPREFSYRAYLVSVITNEFYRYNMKIDSSKMKWLEPDYEHLGERMREYFENDYRIDNELKAYTYEKLNKEKIKEYLQELYQ